jgi:malate dehydrogenase (oxaloacetate-decarboxylating)(NADP+)
VVPKVGNCIGSPFSITVVVNPATRLSSTSNPPAICSGDIFSYTPTSSTAGTRFQWTRTVVAGISNPSAIGTNNPNRPKVAGIMMLVFKHRVVFMADCTVQQNPDANDLADIAISAAQMYRNVVKQEPRVAFLSYSNFGSSDTPEARKMAEATKIVKQKNPNLIVDGEMQGMLAFNKEILRDNYPFSELVDADVNVLIFPNLTAGNISYHLLKEVGGVDIIGPILLGLKKPFNFLGMD